MGAESTCREQTRPILRLGILGPLTVHVDGWPLPLGPLKQQQVLAMLLCRANSVTSVDTLTDTLWGDEPPRTARKNLQVYVACLRKLLGSDGLDDRLVHRNGGYLLRVAADELDLLDFQQRVYQAREASDQAGVVAGLEAALALWRGGLLDGLTATPHIGAEALRLGARYLAVFEDWAEGELALGNARKVVERIRELAVDHPFRERLRQLEMTALHRAGRQTEALSVFDELRQSLARELGLRPSPATEKLYRSMLGGQPVARPARPLDRPPLVLPPDVADFTGRVQELIRIEQLLAHGQSRIVLITGPVGIGKTSLAVHACGLAGARFPDGRIFVNARTEQGAPRSSRSVLMELLRFAGQSAIEELDGEELAGRWQSWLMGRQVLVAIDDVCDSALLRAVLPLSGSSAVLATTRRHLDEVEYAARVDLGPLEPHEALLLLSGIIGPARAMTDPSAAERIVLTVGLSPLAVRTVGAKLKVLTHLPLEEFAIRLQDPDELLNEMSTRQSSLRSRLAAGLHDLREVERAALQQLGSIPTPWFTQEQAAAVLSELPGVARRILDSLIEANAVTATAAEVTAHSAVYELPRLLRCYLRELAPA